MRKDTAVKLGLLKLELANVNSVNDKKTELISKLCERGLTLNADKCQFNITHIEFIAHILRVRVFEYRKSTLL